MYAGEMLEQQSRICHGWHARKCSQKTIVASYQHTAQRVPFVWGERVQKDGVSQLMCFPRATAKTSGSVKFDPLGENRISNKHVYIYIYIYIVLIYKYVRPHLS